MADKLTDQIMTMTDVELRAALLQLAFDQPDATTDAIKRTLQHTRADQ